MNILIDTHVFVWLDIEPQKLSTNAQQLIADANNTIYLSLISIWEIQIKTQLGKLALTAGIPNVIETQRRVNQLQLMTVSLADILALSTLANHHRDPFDRLLIAQAKERNMSLLTNDRHIQQYNVKALW
ncbi:MAG: type II toxin-antitoxin system VapC family toxin [Chloroflexota bacterium]